MRTTVASNRPLIGADSATFVNVVMTESRSLDAIHLASGLRVARDQMIVYDRRLQHAAHAAGLAVAHPGAS